MSKSAGTREIAATTRRAPLQRSLLPTTNDLALHERGGEIATAYRHTDSLALSTTVRTDERHSQVLVRHANRANTTRRSSRRSSRGARLSRTDSSSF